MRPAVKPQAQELSSDTHPFMIRVAVGVVPKGTQNGFFSENVYLPGVNAQLVLVH